jgi:trk system potassium uptake protein TrkH
VFRPNVVRTIRVGRAPVDAQTRSATVVYFLLFGIIVVVGTGLPILFKSPHELRAAGWDVALTAFGAVAATLNNIGPGLDRVGPTKNYADMTAGSKVLLSLLVALGRLELYAFLVLLLPGFWREQ